MLFNITGFNILSSISSITNLLFGHGILYTGGYDKGISIGFFHVLITHGLAGLFFVLFLTLFFCKNSKTALILFILFLFVFTWYVSYVYWFGALALWCATKIDKQGEAVIKKIYKNNDIAIKF